MKILGGRDFPVREAVDDLADVRLERVLSEEELFGLFGLAPPGRSAPSPQTRAMEGR